MNSSNHEWIRGPFVQPTPSSLPLTRKEDYFDQPCDDSLKRKFNSGNPTKFWISLNDEHPALAKKRYERLFLSFRRIYAKQDFL